MIGDLILWIIAHCKVSVFRTWVKQNFLCIHEYEMQYASYYKYKYYYKCKKCGRIRKRI